MTTSFFLSSRVLCVGGCSSCRMQALRAFIQCAENGRGREREREGKGPLLSLVLAMHSMYFLFKEYTV